MLGLNQPGPANSAEQGALAGEDDGALTGLDLADAPRTAAQPDARSGAAPCELHLLVRYSLREYVRFMWLHSGFLIRRRRIRFPHSLYMQVKSTLAAALHFVLLRRARRTYELTIDEHGIVRTSDTGVTLIDWADVSALRSYSPGLMMTLKRGTLPIPLRCMKSGEADQLRALWRRTRAGLDARRSRLSADCAAP
jgi:hypothetical protein